MSALLWISESKGESIDLGNPLTLMSTFARMGEIAGDRYDEFAELFGVPDATMEDDDVDPEWLESVRQQAREFRSEFRYELSEEMRAVLDDLTESSAATTEDEEEKEEE